MYLWFWKSWRIFFLVWGKTYNGAFRGVFRYAQDNLGVKKVPAPLDKLREMPHFVFCPRQKKNILHDFQNQRYISIFMSQRARERERKRERERERARVRHGSTWSLICLLLLWQCHGLFRIRICVIKGLQLLHKSTIFSLFQYYPADKGIKSHLVQ